MNKPSLRTLTYFVVDSGMIFPFDWMSLHLMLTLEALR